MHISVTTLYMLPDKINEFIHTYTVLAPTVDGSPGLVSARLLVNREAAQVLIVGVYDTEANAREFAHNITFEGSLYSLRDVCTRAPTREYFEVPYVIHYDNSQAGEW